MTTLKSIMKKNERKSIEKCLQLFIKDLHYLQYGLDVELCTNKFIYNKLINTYQDISAYQYACFKPADGLVSFIYTLSSLLFKRQIQIIYKCKPFSSIGAIINNITPHYQLTLKEIIEAIKKIIKLE